MLGSMLLAWTRFVIDVRAADVHADVAGGERLVDVAPAVVEVGAHRVVRPAHRLQHVQRRHGLRVVERRLRARAAAGFHPSAERVDDRRQDPARGVVVLAHLRVAGLAGLLGDQLGIGPQLPPGRRRLVRVEARLAEQLAVVVQRLRVRALRQRDDLALRRRALGEDCRVVLREVRQLLHFRGDVGELAVFTECPCVGEGHLEHRRQRARRELGRERRAGPLVLDRLHDDVRVGLLELRDLIVELLDRGVLAARDQRRDADRDLCRAG